MRTGGGLGILLAATIGLAACSSQESTLVKPPEVVQQPVDVPKRQLQVSPLRRKVLSLLEKKHYRQVLELMNGKSHEGLEKEHLLAINGLLEVGDDAFSLGDYASAAHSFKAVLDAYPAESALRERVSRDPRQIRSCLESCANRMMEQGLEEYRRGRLENAISKWKVVLTISPGRQEARKALDTTTAQLKALQDLKTR